MRRKPCIWGFTTGACGTPLSSAGNPNCTVLRAADAPQADGTPVGKADLFLLGGIAMIEDFEMPSRTGTRDTAPYCAP